MVVFCCILRLCEIDVREMRVLKGYIVLYMIIIYFFFIKDKRFEITMYVVVMNLYGFFDIKLLIFIGL